MKKSSVIRIVAIAIIIAISFTSCKDDSKPSYKKTTISGQIINSQTGLGLPNATLSFYDSKKKSTDATALFFVVTDAYGNYTTNEAFVGTFTLEITADNFFTMTITGFVISEDETLNNFDPITTVQELGTNEVLRIVLTWGISPEDLDSHLTGPLSGGSTRFHMYFSDPAPYGSTVNLDVDDTDSYGPETTTILSYVNGTYRYSVHNYSNSTSSGAIETFNSPATVRVFNSSGLLKTYTAPAASATAGDTWRVFDINVSGGVPTFVTTNTYEYFGDEYTITKK